MSVTADEWRARYDEHFENLYALYPEKPPDWRQKKARERTIAELGPQPGGGLLGGLKEKLGMKLISSFLPGIVKDIGDGKYGVGPQKVYWWFAGKKTWISLGVGAVWAFGHYVVLPALASCAPECVQPDTIPQIESWLGMLGSAAPWLVMFGLADAGLRLDPPKKGVYVTPPVLRS